MSGERKARGQKAKAPKKVNKDEGAERSDRASKDGESAKSSRGDAVKRGLTDAVSTFSVGTLGQVAAVVSALGAFVAIVLLYHVLFPPAVEEAAATDAASQTEVVAEEPSAPAEEPEVVGSPWTADGSFSTGNMDLDKQVKEFCDAFSNQELSAWDNAHNVYNTIVWNSSPEFSAATVPSGTNWDSGAAKQYFAKSDPQAGVAGDGDVYDQAAVIAYCLRYFGMSDAMAVPLYSWQYGGSGGALCLVTDGYGYERVCDPTYGSDGWMLDRYLYSITVEDIGQDLSKVEEMGLSVQKQAQDQSQAQGTDQGYDQGEQQSESTGAGAYYDDGTGEGYDSGYDQSYDQGGEYDSYDYGYDGGYGYDSYGDYGY